MATTPAPYPSVIATFPAYVQQVEGFIPYMYTDADNYVTTLIGNKIDNGNAGPALALPWKHASTGILATPAEITAAWQGVKNAGLAGVGGGDPRFAALNDLRLTGADAQTLMGQKLSSDAAILSKRFIHYSTMPANAQRALHAMAWAMGAEFVFPKFQAALNAIVPNFIVAANESGTRNKDIGNIKHNEENKQEFVVANAVVQQGLPFDQIYGIGGLPLTVPLPAGLQATTNVAALAVATGKVIVSMAILGGLGYVVLRGLRA
jgi:hypothetical protein